MTIKKILNSCLLMAVIISNTSFANITTTIEIINVDTEMEYDGTYSVYDKAITLKFSGRITVGEIQGAIQKIESDITRGGVQRCGSGGSFSENVSVLFTGVKRKDYKHVESFLEHFKGYENIESVSVYFDGEDVSAIKAIVATFNADLKQAEREAQASAEAKAERIRERKEHYSDRQYAELVDYGYFSGSESDSGYSSD